MVLDSVVMYVRSRGRRDQRINRSSRGKSVERCQSFQRDQRDHSGGRSGQRDRGGQDGHGQNRNEVNSSLENINTGGGHRRSFGSTNNLHDRSNRFNMNRRFTSDMNTSSAKRGRDGQRGGSARDGRHEDRSSHYGNDYGKAYRDGNRGRRNRSKSRGEGKEEGNNTMSDSNEGFSDSTSDSCSTVGSCSNINAYVPKHKSRKSGGRGRNKSRKNSTHGNDDIVDEKEVFYFLLKECKGLVRFEEFHKKCHLFPPKYDIIKWLQNHRRRIRVYLKDDSISHVGPLNRDAKLCIGHNGLFRGRSCRSKTCDNFHVCQKYVAGHCKFGGKCRYGHSFKGDHNVALMRKLGMDETFTDEDLRILLRSRYPLLCSKYCHTGRCDNPDSCPNLHLCKNYVTGKCRRGESCNFCHNLTSNHNRWVLSMCEWIASVVNEKEDFVKKVILIAHLRRQQKRDEDDDNHLPDYDTEGFSDEDAEESPVDVVKAIARRNRFKKNSVSSSEEDTDSDASFGSTSNLYDHSNMPNMNRRFISDMNLLRARRGRGRQRGGCARSGRYEDRSSHDGNDHGKAYRGGNQGRGNRSRSRGEGTKKGTNAIFDSNGGFSDSTSDSCSIIGSCSNFNDFDPKNKPRRRRRGGRGRNRSRKNSTKDEDDKDDDDDYDLVDENEVFYFLLKECKGLVSFEEFQQKCHLFPPDYDIIKWLQNHRRRIRVYLKGDSVTHVGPLNRAAKLCIGHNGLFRGRSCRSKKCDNFHVCQKYIAGHCKFESRCRYGHNFKGDHNVELMRKLGLDETFTDEDLQILLRSRYPLLCSQYSYTGRCDNSENCPDLHMCKRYVIGNCGRGEFCNFGHSLKSNHNSWVLSMCEWIASVVNEKEDFVKKIILIAHPRSQQNQYANDDNSLSDGLSEQNTEESPVGISKSVDRRNRIYKKSVTSSEEVTDSGASETKEMPHNVAEVRRNRPHAKPPLDTVIHKSWLMDDAENKPICSSYIAGTCSSCTKGHHPNIAEPYLWQIKFERWVTLDPQHNEHVEREFCDGVEVIEVWDGCTFAFEVHIGRDGVRNHKALVYACNGSLVDKPGNVPVRRLSTESYASNQETAGFFTQWRWYWRDDQYEWTTYDKGLFQKTLEAKYLFDQSSYLFSRAGVHFKYRINFRTLKQVNLDTRKERPISRRPLFVSKADVRAKKFPQSFDLPSSPEFPDNFSPWDMTSDFELVELDELKEEFSAVKRNFTKTMESDRFQVTFIYRVQNRKLLNEYSTKKQNMVDDILRENDNREVCEKILFHGTDSIDTCRAICTNNFDFRTSGKNATVYGEGSYFAVRAKYSHSYTKPGPDRQRYIFQANVLTGLAVKGDRSYRRPPVRPGQQHKLFDSCVDNEQNPDIFVIFDMSQSYPAYLIAYKELYNFAAVNQTGVIFPNSPHRRLQHPSLGLPPNSLTTVPPNPSPTVPPNPSPMLNPSPLQQKNPTQMTKVNSERQQRFNTSSKASGLSRGHSEGQFRSQTSQESTQSALTNPETSSVVETTSEASSKFSKKLKSKDGCVIQ